MLDVSSSHGFTEIEFKWPLFYLKVVLKFKGDTGDLYMTKNKPYVSFMYQLTW